MGTQVIRSLKFWTAVALTVMTAACTTTESPASSSGGNPSFAEGSAASGGLTVEGSLTTSGLYDATWSWEAGNAADIGDIGSITLTSDKGTFGNITVKRDGSIRFGSGAPELIAASDFTGTGAQVTLGTGPVAGGYVCSFTVDNDLTGTDSSVLHIKGTLTFHSDDETTPC